jgi:amino acid transporter
METPEKEIAVPEEAHAPFPENADIETADRGIVNHANPLAKKLRSRHMQMIAIGIYS